MTTPKEEQKHTDLLPKKLSEGEYLCSVGIHGFPNMESGLHRKCMRCGIKESEVGADEMDKMFKDAYARMQARENNSWSKYPPKTYEDAMTALETEQTMHKAWRKRAEEAESELLTRKADCHEEVVGALQFYANASNYGGEHRTDLRILADRGDKVRKALPRATNHQGEPS